MYKKAATLTTALFSLLLPVFSHAQIAPSELETSLGFHSETTGNRDAGGTGINFRVRKNFPISKDKIIMDFLVLDLKADKYSLNIEQVGKRVGKDKPSTLEAFLGFGFAEKEYDLIESHVSEIIFGPYLVLNKADLRQDIVEINHSANAFGLMGKYIYSLKKGWLELYAAYAGGKSNDKITISSLDFAKTQEEKYSIIEAGSGIYWTIFDYLNLGLDLEYRREKTGDAVKKQFKISPEIEFSNGRFGFMIRSILTSGKSSESYSGNTTELGVRMHFSE